MSAPRPRARALVTRRELESRLAALRAEVRDPRAGVPVPSPFISATSGGNANLDPEKADTWTVGIVLSPSMIPGLRASLDYYDIDIKGAVGTLAVQDIINRCYVNGSTDLCKLITVNSSNVITHVDNFFINLQELIAYMKANQAKMQYSSAGVGSGTHLPCALLNFTLGVNITMVPYRGENPALQDVIADRLDYMCSTIQSGAVQAKQGTVKGIAVMAPRRAAIIPNLPTTGEQGLKGVEATVWNGFFFPKGTPKAFVERLAKATSDAIDTPAVVDRYKGIGVVVPAKDRRSPEYFTKFVQSEIDRWGVPIKASGMKIQ